MSTQHIVCARAARREFAEAFEGGISQFREGRMRACLLSKVDRLPASAARSILHCTLEPDVADLAFEGTVETTNRLPDSKKNFLVMARPRPMNCIASMTTEVDNNAIVSHDGRVHRDGRTLYLVHSRFHLDRVFATNQGNSNIFKTACLPLVHHAEAGFRSTLMMFGQTGTGKTYTTFGIQEELGMYLEAQQAVFTVKIFELAGEGGREHGFDLLRQREKVKVLEGGDGFVHVRGAKEVRCSSKAQFDDVLAEAKLYRFSQVTERNEQSSRSHAIFEISMESRGVLRLVDLAGSERNTETTQHTRQMATIGGQINSSLQSLKECGRILHIKTHGDARVHVPYRRSKLTHLLRDCFTDSTHKTVVIGTLSPLADDVEHTLNTLQHLATLRGGSDRKKKSSTTHEGGKENFDKINGRGKQLHSKLQDNDQLNMHAFHMVGPVGGGILKKYDPDMVKYEAFIDARWHPELKARVDEDLWIYQEADKEVIHPLNLWREERYTSRRNHCVSTWSCEKVQEFLAEVFIDRIPMLPPQMDGKMLDRLGAARLRAILGGDGEILHEALVTESRHYNELQRSQSERNARIGELSKKHLSAKQGKENVEEPEA